MFIETERAGEKPLLFGFSAGNAITLVDSLILGSFYTRGVGVPNHLSQGIFKFFELLLGIWIQ